MTLTHLVRKNCSVRNWWKVCLTNGRMSPTSKSWWRIVDKFDLYQLYLNACVGKPVCNVTFWKTMYYMNQWEDFKGSSVTFKPLQQCRECFDSSRNWTKNPIFESENNITILPRSFRGWFGKTLVTGKFANLSVSKQEIYDDYVKHARSSGTCFRQPSFWRLLHMTNAKQNETWDTITFNDIKTLRSKNPDCYSSMQKEYDCIFGTANC